MFVWGVTFFVAGGGRTGRQGDCWLNEELHDPQSNNTVPAIIGGFEEFLETSMYFIDSSY